MNKNLIGLLSSLAFTLTPIISGFAQHSVPHRWSEMLLESIRNDRARPPVHARNLFHVSAAMYDAWAAYDETSVPWLLGNTRGDHHVPFDGVASPTNLTDARNAAISYAAFRLILHRFKNSPGAVHISTTAKSLMLELGYDPDYTSTDYTNGLPASLGNYIGASYIEFGLGDGANESGGYSYLNYEPVNPPLIVKEGGNPFIINPNRWQPLQLDSFIDQSGNVVPGGAASFIGPEWGSVVPFSLSSADRTDYQRDGYTYKVYFDPGAPPYIQNNGEGTSDFYKWGFELVSKWASHLDQSDNVMLDISPKSIGNAGPLPTTFQEYLNFYNTDNGGDNGVGYQLNPKTGLPYLSQVVPRGDYTRVLAEFWADGPSSETPPGHWYTILNSVMDNPLFVKKMEGTGEILEELEYDVKAYFILGGAMHDAAISAWGVKGWYDYVRPISAIRYMAGKGQSSDPNQPNYSTQGINLSQGFVELVKTGDLLQGQAGENIGKIKLYTWKGPNLITNPETDQSGVGWILASDWWPYQRPTFVTPPFAGYVSGHSTYSRAAADVLTLLTGDEYFPGGLAEFDAPMNEFLIFEEGPSVNIKLQWARYRDASDQCSLSRIWGGIHPPQDDIPGRIIGQKVAAKAFTYGMQLFSGLVTGLPEQREGFKIFPNPVSQGDDIWIESSTISRYKLKSITGRVIYTQEDGGIHQISTDLLSPGLYIIEAVSNGKVHSKRLWIR